MFYWTACKDKQPPASDYYTTTYIYRNTAYIRDWYWNGEHWIMPRGEIHWDMPQIIDERVIAWMKITPYKEGNENE